MNKIGIGSMVSLSEAEQEICKAVATAKHAINRTGGVENKRVGPQDDQFTDLNGFGGELAFCKLFNIFPDFSLEIRNSSTDRGDAILPAGYTVDVKTTVYPSGKLIAAPSLKANHDLYALMTGKFPAYTFRGFISTETLHNDLYKRQMGDHLTHWAYQSELSQWWECIPGYDSHADRTFRVAGEGWEGTLLI